MAIVLDGTTGITTPALDTETKIAPTDLGTGTPDATNFLRGDGSWQTISTTPTTSQVLAATAGASLGAVGTYAFLGQPSNTNANFTAGTNYAGSGLRFTGIQMIPDFQAFDGLPVGNTPSGTWRAMGTTTSGRGDVRRATLFLRIS